MTNHYELSSQIVDTCLAVKAGENVWIHSWDHTVDLASQIALACRHRGAYPFVTVLTEKLWQHSLTETPKELLEEIPEHYIAALEKTDAFIFMIGPRHPVNWEKIPEEKRELANIWFLESNKYIDKWRKIISENRVRMLGVEYCLATRERAKSLGLDYNQWRKVMLAGCLADQKQISEGAKRLKQILRTEKEVKIKTGHGTDLSFRLINRPAISGDSIVTEEDAANGIVKFLPSGFVEVAPDEDSAKGVVVYDVAIPVRGGRKVKGLKLCFQQGEVTDYSAKSHVDVFDDYVNSTGGDAMKFGFVGFGLNPGLRHGFTQDDKVLGSITVGVGGNIDKGGKNRTDGNSHWWATMTKATVKIGRDTVLVGGRFTS
jgi:leucyl aminopeptidase (aminopeptidase T)